MKVRVSGLVKGLIYLFMCFWASTPCSAQLFSDRTTFLPGVPDPQRFVASISVADYNADGLPDIYHFGRLLRQNTDGTFDISLEKSGIKNPVERSNGGIFGDLDDDGMLDLMMLNPLAGSQAWINRNGHNFVVSSGDFKVQSSDPVQTAIFGDVNNDNRPDLLLVNRNGQHSLLTAPGPSSSGIVNLVTGSASCVLPVIDLEPDGTLDFFSPGCNGDPTNVLLRYRAIFRGFQNITLLPMSTPSLSHDGVWFDYNNDGRLDMYVANEAAEFLPGFNNLFMNLGAQKFTDVAQQAGIAEGLKGTNLRAQAADLDNDGFVDLFTTTDSKNVLYHNTGLGRFEKQPLTGDPIEDYFLSTTVVDINGDGWVDLIQSDSTRYRLLINNGGTNHWLEVQLRDDESNRLGVGATIVLSTTAGMQVRMITAGSGHYGQGNDLVAHFGLGSDNFVRELTVTWSNGRVETFSDIAADQLVTLVRGQGVNSPPETFDLREPADGASIPVSVDSIRFSWNAASDSDAVEYTLFITGRGQKLRIPDLSETHFTLASSLLIDNLVYDWTVVASDGHSKTGTPDSFQFSNGTPGNAVATLPQPVVFDFGIEGASHGEIQFIDFDGDGDLDVYQSGLTTSGWTEHIYEAVERTTMSLADGVEVVFVGLTRTTFITSIAFPNTAWGDIDGDGILDFIVSGIDQDSSTPVINLFIQRGTVFQSVSIDTFEGVWGGDLNLIDYDRDGDLDVFVCGSTGIDPNSDGASRLYRNDENLSFFDTGINFPGFVSGQGAWGDLDGDGDADLVLTGDLGGGNFFSGIYRNDNADFVAVTTGLPELSQPAVDLGDVDSDGDLDVVLAGGRLSPGIFRGETTIFLNKGGMNFVPSSNLLLGVTSGDVVFSDYDGDGDVDLLVIGTKTTLGHGIGILYRNVRGNLVPELDLGGLQFPSASIGDYNRDGDADILVSGISPDGTAVSSFFINRIVPELIPQQ